MISFVIGMMFAVLPGCDGIELLSLSIIPLCNAEYCFHDSWNVCNEQKW